jgi:hypothetical protein
MDSKIVPKTTLKVIFPGGFDQPTEDELIIFTTGTLQLQHEDINTLYYDTKEMIIYIKLHDPALLQQLLQINSEILFRFANGGNEVLVKVELADARSNFKLVKVFGVIPEVPDGILSDYMKQYGNIRRVHREKFKPSMKFPVFNGNRGVFMDMTAEIIPQFFTLCGEPAKIYYPGMKTQCFHCKAIDHVKKDCPKHISTWVRSRWEFNQWNRGDQVEAVVTNIDIDELNRLELAEFAADDQEIINEPSTSSSIQTQAKKKKPKKNKK